MKLEVGKFYENFEGRVLECVAVWSRASVDGFQATLIDEDGDSYRYGLDGTNPYGSQRLVEKKESKKLYPFLYKDQSGYIRKASVYFATEKEAIEYLNDRFVVSNNFIRLLTDEGITV